MAKRKTHIFLLPLVLLWLLWLPVAHSQASGTQQQSIQFLPIADRAVNSAPFQVVAGSSAYLPITLSVTGPATLSGRLLTLSGIGTVSVTATQAGNSQYAPATAQLSFQSLSVTPALSFSTASVPYGTAFTADLLNATAVAAPLVDASADTATITSQTNASVLDPSSPPNYLASSSVFQYSGSAVGPTTTPIGQPAYIATGAPAPYGFDFTAAFTCDCQQFELAMGSGGGSYRIWVDGAFTSTDATFLPGVFPSTAFVLVKFPDKRPRQIRVTDHYNSPFYGVYTASGDTLSAPQAPVGKKVLIFGDSWTAPTVLQPVLPPNQPGINGGGYPQYLSSYFNWSFEDDGIGGSGFTVSGTDALGRNFAQRILTDVCPYTYDAIVLLGGTNDEGADEATMQAGVTTALSELHQCEASVPVYFYGPQFSVPQLNQAMAAAVSQANATAPGSVFYTNMGELGWFYGSPTDPSTGNIYLYFNGHPTPLGHDFLAEQIALDLVGKFPALLPQPYALATPVAVPGTFSFDQANGVLLPTGTTNISASFSPQDAATYASVSGTATLTVAKATTSITAAFTQQPGTVTLSATVAPQIAGTPTGTVQFFSGTVLLGTVPLAANGAALTLTSAQLPQGSNSISETYAGDANFLPSSSSSTLAVVNQSPDFSFHFQAQQLTVLPGSSGSVTLTATPVGGLSGPLAATCSGAPANVVCSLSSTAFTAGQLPQTATLTVQAFSPTASGHASLQTPFQSSPWQRFRGVASPTALCSLALLLPFWRRRHRLLQACITLVLAVFALTFTTSLTGCGSSSKIAYAAPGTYAVQVAITTGGTPSVSHTQTLTVVIP